MYKQTMNSLILQHFFTIYLLTFILISFSDAAALAESTHGEENLVGNSIIYRLVVEGDTQFSLEKHSVDRHRVLEIPGGAKNTGHPRPDISEYVEKEDCYPVGIDKKRICQRGVPLNIPDGNKTIPRSCKEVLDRGNKTSGVYQIQPIKSQKPFNVLCDMETNGGGWTHIQKRYDESQDFDLGWREYKFGFGDLAGEFWIGLENIYEMTAFVTNELLVEITDRDNLTKYAYYKSFRISPEVDGYTLNTLEDYTGDAGDSLSYSVGCKFTTKDFDRDSYATNCAELCVGGWWFNNCYHGFLNGKHINAVLPTYIQYSGIQWDTFHRVPYSNAKSRMLIRTLDLI